MSLKRTIGRVLGQMVLDVVTDSAKTFAIEYPSRAANGLADRRWPRKEEDDDGTGTK